MSTLVTLDGSASTNGTVGNTGALTYVWSIVSSPATVLLSSPTQQKPTFTPAAPGIYTFQLTVTESTGLKSAPKNVIVTVIDDQSPSPRFPPVARPRALGLEAAIFVSGTPGTPQSVVLDNGTQAKVDLFDLVSATSHPTAEQTRGLLTFKVYADGKLFATGYSAASPGRSLKRVVLSDGTKTNVLHFARSGNAVVFDATQSQSPTGVVTATKWTQTGGPFLFTTKTDNIFSLVVPAAGTYDFDVTVTDNSNLVSKVKKLRVYVLPVGSTGQGPPTAVAEAPKQVSMGSDVTLSAKGSVFRTSAGKSSEASPTYSWKQVSGPLVPLTVSGDGAKFTPAIAGVYGFEVTATDANGVSDTATIYVVVAGAGGAPTVSVSAPTDVKIDSTKKSVTVTLQASGQASAGTLKFVWSQVDGSPVLIDTGTDSANPKVTITVAGFYSFSVTAVDQNGSSAPELMEFDVLGGEDTEISKGGGTQSSGGGGCAIEVAERSPMALVPGLALLVLFVLLRRRS
jgi:PKD repeat protein